MDKLQTVEKKVKNLYQEKDPNRADWADWMLDNHVLIVADNATQLAKKYKANEELARVAALLHDIADAKMKRENKEHEALSLKIARELMTEAGYSEEDIKLVVDDAIRYHSCYDNEQPASLEGKILSTADSIAHLKTDFYLYATSRLGSILSFEDVKKFVLDKIERDINNKMFFADVKEDLRPDYNRIKELFSR